MGERSASAAAWRVGVDIGGTFTDVVAIETKSGAARIAKVATRPGDRVNSLFDALAAVGIGQITPILLHNSGGASGLPPAQEAENSGLS